MVSLLLATLLLPALGSATVCGQVYPASHIAPTTRCNFEGSLQSPQPLGKPVILEKPRSERTKANCRNFCLDNQYCLSYSYNVKTGACNQYSRKVVDMGPTAGRTGTFLWNRYCWAQNYTTSPGLQNSGFEATGRNARQLRPWTRQSSDSNILPSQSSPGSNGTAYSALLRVGTQIGVFNQSVSQGFSACPNTTYYIQPMYKYLGAVNGSLSSIAAAFSLATANGQGSCASAASTRIEPGQASTDWSILGATYDDSPAPPYYVLSAGGGAQGSFSVSVSAYIDQTPKNIDDPPQPDPELDEYLVDFNVQIAGTPEQAYDGVSCGIGSGNFGSGAGAGAGRL